MKHIYLFLFAMLLSVGLQAQKKYQVLTEKKGVTVYHKMKLNKEGKQQIWLKFKNKSGETYNMNLTLGYYMTGTLEEEAEVATCSKSSFFARMGAPVYGLLSETLSNENLKDDQFDLKVLDFRLEKTEACEKQH